MPFDRRDFLKQTMLGVASACLGNIAVGRTVRLGGTFTFDDSWQLQYLQLVEKVGEDRYHVDDLGTFRLWRGSDSRGKPQALYAEFDLKDVDLSTFQLDQAVCDIGKGELDTPNVNGLVDVIRENLTQKGKDGFLRYGGGESRLGKKLFWHAYARGLNPRLGVEWGPSGPPWRREAVVTAT